MEQANISWLCVKHAWLYSNIRQALKENIYQLLVLNRGTFISASAYPTARFIGKKQRQLFLRSLSKARQHMAVLGGAPGGSSNVVIELSI